LKYYYETRGSAIPVNLDTVNTHELAIKNNPLSHGLYYFMLNKINGATGQFSKIIENTDAIPVMVQYEEPEKEIFDQYLQAEIENRGGLNVEVKVLAYYYLVNCHLKLNNIQTATGVINQFSGYIANKQGATNLRILSYAYRESKSIEKAILAERHALYLEKKIDGTFVGTLDEFLRNLAQQQLNNNSLSGSAVSTSAVDDDNEQEINRDLKF